MLGDFGGIYSLLSFLIGLVVIPVAQHSFILKAIQKLYMARTLDEKLFDTGETNL